MARGGKREGAGRKADPNSKRQQALARRATKPVAAGVQKGKGARGFTLPGGKKSADAPASWPFGTEQAADQPPSKPVESAPAMPPKQLTAREYLSQVVNDAGQDEKLRLDAAKKLIEFEEAKPAPVGKKEARQDAAKKVSRFAPVTPPRLAVAGGRRVD